MKKIEGQLSARDLQIAIVVSRFNSVITEKLLTGAMNCLTRHNGKEENISVVWCPGAFEISAIAHQLSTSKKFDAIICLGCIIRGETPHFDYVASETSKGIASLANSSGIPIAYGVLTTDTMEQATERAGGKSGNKGWDAAMSVMEMADIYKQISSSK
ncbi:MAG: 6,7-dimethyl-8-ribityllumazine synthase [Bacteroidota bacterium]